MIDIVKNLESVRDRMEKAAQQWDRDMNKINLIAVSKLHDLKRIHPAIGAGQLVFGENRVQEATDKWRGSKDEQKIELHLIGPLQTNKVEQAVSLFDTIQTVDRPKLAAALADQIQKNKRDISCFVQVNTGEEEQKSGITPTQATDFIKQCENEYGLKISGLMCLPPAGEEPAPHFALLAKLAEKSGLEHLSMGMSHDFETAIAFGATYIRVGQEIFGPRPGC